MNLWHRKEYISTGVEKAIYKEVVTKQIISCYGLPEFQEESPES